MARYIRRVQDQRQTIPGNREQRESPLAFLIAAERELGSDAALHEALPR